MIISSVRLASGHDDFRGATTTIESIFRRDYRVRCIDRTEFKLQQHKQQQGLLLDYESVPLERVVQQFNRERRDVVASADVWKPVQFVVRVPDSCELPFDNHDDENGIEYQRIEIGRNESDHRVGFLHGFRHEIPVQERRDGDDVPRWLGVHLRDFVLILRVDVALQFKLLLLQSIRSKRSEYSIRHVLSAFNG